MVTDYGEGGGATKWEGGGASEVLHLQKKRGVSHPDKGAQQVLG